MNETLVLTPFHAYEGGYSTAGDVVTQTADGTPLQDLWDEYIATIGIRNEQRIAIANLLCFSTQRVRDVVPQNAAVAEFEEASEFGVPGSVRGPGLYASCGYGFKWFDRRVGFTWKFLLDAPRDQVDAIHATVLEADGRNIFRTSLRPLLDNRAYVNDEGANVLPMWNGDGSVPPPYEGTTFDGAESHFLTSGATVIDSADVEQMVRKLRGKGADATPGTRIVVLCNPVEAEVVRRFRANTVNNNGANALWDFIPSAIEVPRLTAESVLGQTPPVDYNGLPVFGSYGPALLVESSWMPVGYITAFVTAGPNNPANAVGLREHAQVSARGLRIIPGNNNAYPLIDSYYSRGIGSGARRRSNGVAMQIKSSGSYSVPAGWL